MKKQRKTRTLAARLHDVEVGISGVQNNPDIQEQMSKFGYTPERIAEGKALLAEVRRGEALQAESYSNKYTTSDEFVALQSTCYSRYIITLKVVRVAFRTLPGRLQEVHATGERRRSLSGWLDDSRIMYDNLLTPAMLTEMAKFGYTAERLQQEREGVEAIAALYGKRMQELGAAQQSTIERDRLVDQLCDWYSDFRAIARVALYDEPQWLEVLGIVVKS
jgi:hypothetical protein